MSNPNRELNRLSNAEVFYASFFGFFFFTRPVVGGNALKA